MPYNTALPASHKHFGININLDTPKSLASTPATQETRLPKMAISGSLLVKEPIVTEESFAPDTPMAEDENTQMKTQVNLSAASHTLPSTPNTGTQTEVTQPAPNHTAPIPPSLSTPGMSNDSRTIAQAFVDPVVTSNPRLRPGRPTNAINYGGTGDEAAKRRDFPVYWAAVDAVAVDLTNGLNPHYRSYQNAGLQDASEFRSVKKQARLKVEKDRQSKGPQALRTLRPATVVQGGSTSISNPVSQAEKAVNPAGFVPDVSTILAKSVHSADQATTSNGKDHDVEDSATPTSQPPTLPHQVQPTTNISIQPRATFIQHPLLKLSFMLRNVEDIGAIVSYFPELDPAYAKALEKTAATLCGMVADVEDKMAQ